MTPKCERICLWTLAIGGGFFLVFSISMFFVFPAILKSQITDQVVMTSATYNQWGEVPGNSFSYRQHVIFTSCEK